MNFLLLRRNPTRRQILFQFMLGSVFLASGYLSGNLRAEGDPESNAPSDLRVSVRLQVRDTKITDAQGNPVVLRGIYSREEWLGSEQEVIRFKEWGVNFVRFLLAFDPQYWQTVNNGQEDEQKRCILRPENIEKTKTKCRWFEKHKIYYILEVPWRWYGIPESLSSPDLLERQCAEMYRTLAENFREFDYLVGYCMFSEIYVAPDKYKDYKKICTAIADAVQEADPGRIVSATGVNVSGPNGLGDETRIERPNVIYDFHFYDIKSFVAYRPYFGDMRYPGRIPHGYSCQSYYLDRKLLETFIAPAVAFSERYRVPVWCGEYGAFNDAPDGSSDRWMRDVCRIFEKNQIPWIIWTWKKGWTDVPSVWKDLWQGKWEENEVTVSPHGGTYVDPLRIQIDSWNPAGRIFYTLDESEPDEHSIRYTQPFQIHETTTIKARLICEETGSGPLDTAHFEFGGLKGVSAIENASPGLQARIENTAVEKIEEFTPSETAENEKGRFWDKMHFPTQENKTIIYEGWMEIPQGGRYFFYPKAFGAYTISMDGQQVCRHDATKLDYARTSVGIVTLESGFHTFKLIYSKPAGLEDGFELKLQRDSEPVDSPFKVGKKMFYYTENK
jgi:endoglucanase